MVKCGVFFAVWTEFFNVLYRIFGFRVFMFTRKFPVGLCKEATQAAGIEWFLCRL
jgi:hypothetical protein